jgi:multidrug resistance protein MdtO
MAPPAGDPGYAAGLAQLLKPRPGRLEFAGRVALICALTTLVAEIYQTPEPALTTYVVFFLNKPDRAESLILNVVMLLLVSVVLGFLLPVTMAVIDQPAWRVASMAAISFCLLFAASASKLRPVGSIIALIVGYGLDVVAMQSQLASELATRVILYAWLFVGVPAGVSMAVNLLLAPAPRRLAERALAQRLRLAADLLSRPDKTTRRAFRESWREGMGEIQTWLKLAALERTSTPGDISALRQAAESTIALLALVDVVDRGIAGTFPAPVRKRLARTLREMASILTAGGYPVGIAFDRPKLDVPLSPFAAKVLADIGETLAGFAEKPDPDLPARHPEEKSGGFFLPDAFTNAEHVHYALKTTAAAMFCYVLYSLLDWPGIHTCFITCYIVSLGTAAETIEKLTLRILGALVGGAAGLAAIVFLIPSFTSIPTLMTVVFLGALASAWVAAGDARISYAGFQIAFAFFLCVIQGPAPAFDLAIARDRVIGILLGNVVVYLLFTHVWPVSVAKRIDPAIAALLRRLSGMMTAANLSDRRSLASEAAESLGAIERDLDLAQYEPPRMRPARSWLDTRRGAAREIGVLEGPLLLSTAQPPSFSSSVAHRLDRLADSLDASEPSPEKQQEGGGKIQSTENRKAAQGPLDEVINMHLRTLEQALARRSEEEGAAGYAPI